MAANVALIYLTVDINQESSTPAIYRCNWPLLYKRFWKVINKTTELAWYFCVYGFLAYSS